MIIAANTEYKSMRANAVHGCVELCIIDDVNQPPSIITYWYPTRGYPSVRWGYQVGSQSQR